MNALCIHRQQEVHKRTKLVWASSDSYLLCSLLAQRIYFSPSYHAVSLSHVKKRTSAFPLSLTVQSDGSLSKIYHCGLEKCSHGRMCRQLLRVDMTSSNGAAADADGPPWLQCMGGFPFCLILLQLCFAFFDDFFFTFFIILSFGQSY